MNAALNHARSNIDAAGARYFANKKAFYDHLWKNSFDADGNPIRDVSGWELENGSAVALPYDKNHTTKGGTYVSFNDALDVVPGKFSTKWVQFKGMKYQIHTHAHTHPQSYGLYPPGFRGGADAAMLRFVNNPIKILHNANLYRVDGTVFTSDPIDVCVAVFNIEHKVNHDYYLKIKVENARILEDHEKENGDYSEPLLIPSKPDFLRKEILLYYYFDKDSVVDALSQ